MKKKLLVAILALTAALCCAFGLAACGGSDDTGKDNEGNHQVDEYTIIFDANGGYFSNDETTFSLKVKEGETITPPTAPLHSRFNLKGWTINKTDGILWQFTTDKVMSNLTFYAVWDEPIATILDFDDAKIDGKNISMLVEYNTTMVSLNDKVVCSNGSIWRVYYDSLGQIEIPTKIVAGRDGCLSLGDNIFYIIVNSPDSNVINTYELKIYRSFPIFIKFFDPNNNILATETAYTGYEFNLDYTPDIPGYTFKHWKDKRGEKVNTFIPEANTNFYADCTAISYNATLDLNGGYGLTVTEYIIEFNTKFNFLIPMREGYTFVGWYIEDTKVADNNGKSINPWSFTEDKTVYAKWNINDYSLKLNKDTEEGGVVQGEGTYDYGSSVTVNATTNNGYTWLGWYDDSDELITSEFTYNLTILNYTLLTAKWIACPITLIKNIESAGHVEGVDKTVAGKETTITAKTYSNYSWAGWFNGDELLTDELSYTFIMPSSLDDSKEYTAKWVEFKIYNSKELFSGKSGGNITQSNTTEKVGKEITVTATVYMGYTFRGWYNGSNLLSNELIYTFNVPNESATYSPHWELDDKLKDFIFDSNETTCKIESIRNKACTGIYVPEYVTSIAYGAFNGCYKLFSLAIPGSAVDLIGEAFGTTHYSESVVAAQKHYNSQGAVTHTTKYSLPATLQYIGLLNGEISTGMFNNCTNITNVTLEESVTSIGENAFLNCNGLTKITIPNSVTQISKNAFNNCKKLNNISLPETLTLIDDNAFYNCIEIKNFTIPASVKKIGKNVFYGCNWIYDLYYTGDIGGWCEMERQSNILSSSNGRKLYINEQILSGAIIIPDGVSKINDFAFYNQQNITSVSIPNSVTLIGKSAFSYCNNLTDINIPSSVTSIGDDAFRDCSALTNIIIPDSITKIGRNAFCFCSVLTSITIPDSVTSIGNDAFRFCSALTSITIPNNVTSIGSDAFSECSALTSITIPDGVTSIGEGTFHNTAYYNNEDNWQDDVLYIGNHLIAAKDTISGSYEIKQGTLTIANAAFRDCIELTSVTIPDSVTSIGGSAFRECSALTSVTIGKSVTSIGDYTFYKCSSLTSITIPDSVTSIVGSAFSMCSWLTDINFDGTKEQWKAIKKSSNWNYYTGNYTVHCTDGDLTKSES